MSTSIINVYRESIPSLRFIGKKYSDTDRVDGGFGTQWEKWWSNGWFSVLENLSYKENDATIGLMRYKEGEAFEYWIGMFCVENTVVPDGYDHVDFDATDLGVCWLYGKELEVFCLESLCAERLVKEGYKVIPDDKGAYWFYERYNCPRFTTPDDKGNIILDIVHFVEKK